MNRVVTLLLLGLLVALLVVGHWTEPLRLDPARPVAGIDTDSLGHLAEHLPPPVLRPPRGRQSFYQGVEVRLRGVRWREALFGAQQHHGIGAVGGRFDMESNRIDFDPDLPTRGLPDLSVRVLDVGPFRPGSFLENIVGDRYRWPTFLRKRLDESGPYETYTWAMRDPETERVRQKITMELWLAQFTLQVRTQFAPDDALPPGIDRDARHPVTGLPLDLDDEWDNQRYPPLHLLLELHPRADTWYVGQQTTGGALIQNERPRIGIAAVEMIGVDKDSAFDEALDYIGADVQKGHGLVLYDRLRDVPAVAAVENAAPEGAPPAPTRAPLSATDFAPYYRLIDGGPGAINAALFDRPQYAALRIANIGTWKRGNFLTGREKFADQLVVKFAVHLFVIGSWSVRRPRLAAPEPPPALHATGPSLADRVAGAALALLPTFGLPAVIGRALSFLLLGGAVLLATGLFVPAVGLVVRRLLRLR